MPRNFDAKNPNSHKHLLILGLDPSYLLALKACKQECNLDFAVVISRASIIRYVQRCI